MQRSFFAAIRWFFATLVTIFAGCAMTGEAGPEPDPAAARAEMNRRAEAATAPKLVALVDEDRQLSLSVADLTGTLYEVNELQTPEGYRLKYRFREIGVPIAQALSLSKDPQLRMRLLEAARFASGDKTRAEGLLVLATEKNPEHFKFFREAMLDTDIGIQFAAVEALEAWALPEAIPLLLGVTQGTWSPLVRVYAAKAVAKLGDERGLSILRAGLQERNWLIRSMSAYYLGDLGKAEDADRMLARIGQEGDNDFATAEVCIAGLKLLAKKVEALPPPVQPPPPPKRAPASVSDIFEMTPLVVTAPRLRISGAQLVDPRIDTRLVALLEKVATQPREAEQLFTDPFLTEMEKRVKTPQGYGLFIRYTNINVLLAEGLSGTTNLTLLSRLENIAEKSPNETAKAVAYVSLGHGQGQVSINMFDKGLREPESFVRFGAVEGLAAQRNPMARGLLASAAQSDASPVVRLYAAYVLGRRGDFQGTDILRRSLLDQDWVIRSMATYYLGQLGDEADFERFIVGLDREDRDHTLAEVCLAVLRMSL